MKQKYVIILNFESGSVDCLYVGEYSPEEKDLDEFIETDLDYKLSNCHWMQVEHPLPRILNF